MQKPNKKQTALAIAGGIIAYVLGGKLFGNKKTNENTSEGNSASDTNSDSEEPVTECEETEGSESSDEKEEE